MTFYNGFNLMIDIVLCTITFILAYKLGRRITKNDVCYSCEEELSKYPTDII